MNLYLDVDGVVNVPFHRGTAGFSDWEDTGFVTWSPAMVGRLGALEVDSHWLTTWRDEANTVLAPLFGWEPLGVLARSGAYVVEARGAVAGPGPCAALCVDRR